MVGINHPITVHVHFGAIVIKGSMYAKIYRAEWTFRDFIIDAEYCLQLRRYSVSVARREDGEISFFSFAA